MVPDRGARLAAPIRPRRRAVVLLASLFLTAGCEVDQGPGPAPTPTPTPAAPAEPAPVSGLQVGIVLPPAGSGLVSLEADVLAREAQRLSQEPGLDVREVRVVEPPSPDFRRDQLAFLADRGAGLVCALGAEATEDLLAVADAFPRTRFCLIGAELIEPPANAFSVTWERGRAASVVGAAAALTAPAIPDAPARVRVLAAGLADLGEFTDAILTGARRMRGTIEVAAVPVGADASAEEAAEATLRAVGDAGPGVVLIAAGGPELAEGVITAAAEVRGLVLGWSVPPTAVLAADDEGQGAVVASVIRRFDVALRLAVRHVSGDIPAPEPLSVADGYALVPGGHSRWRTIRPRLERYVTDLSGTGPVILDTPTPAASPAG